MQLTESNKVHLDHLIQRLSIRYFENELPEISAPLAKRMHDPFIRFNDIKSEWFLRLKKPDFQRETNAWSPIQCRDFIESVFLGRIIPSIILWKSEENGITYILDGAHRLSIIKAWMTDDYGDKADEYYERRDKSHIHKIAEETRISINSRIGSFQEFRTSYDKLQKLIKEGEAPKKKMKEREFLQANFYSDVIGSNSSLYAQYETGNYESAEQSFLRINRQGQALDPWEATLIEYRKGSYSRSIMHIANGGESGHYWPNQNLNEEDQKKVDTFSKFSNDIYIKLFVPPFAIPIQELTVPIFVAPAYFQKHVYLLELIPLLVWNQIAANAEDQIEILKKDFQKDTSKVIDNANEILTKLNYRLEHLSSTKNSPLSLSLVPLFYWYNHRGQHLRALLYGFIYWLFNGSEIDVFNRKIIFSANREKIEYVLYYYKQEIAALAAKSGAGLKAAKSMSDFFEDLINILHNDKNINIDENDIEEKILKLTTSKKQNKSIKRSGRNFTKRDKSQSNINELFTSSVKCHICGGVVNLKYGGIQYDHVEEFRKVKETDPENMRPTHPFCNNNREKIENYRDKKSSIELPKKVNFSNKPISTPIGQLSFWGLESEFPL